MTAETRSNESRWEKRNIFLTIVSTYLLFSSVIAISLMIYSESTIQQDLNHGLGVLHYPSIFIGLSILVVPSSIGAVYLLLKKKNAFGISLGSLLMWTGLSWSVVFLPGTIFPMNDNLFSNSLTTIRDFIMIGSNAVMYIFLIKGWKQDRMRF